MERPGSEALEAGGRLRCAHCGTTVRLARAGGGRMECCDHPMRAARGAGSDSGRMELGGPAASLGRVRCQGCGNEADVLHDGGGTMECCNRAMQSLG